MKHSNFLTGYKLRKSTCCYLREVKVGINKFLLHIYYKSLHAMQWIYDELDTVYRINVFYLPELVIQPITGPEQVLLLDDLHSIFELL